MQLPIKTHSKFSPLRAILWDDVRGTAGFLGMLCQFLSEQPYPRDANHKVALRAIEKAEDAAAAFARLPELAYIGPDGERTSAAYWKAKDALNLLHPHIERRFFQITFQSWLEHTACHYCTGPDPSCTNCHGKGYNDPVLPMAHAVRCAYLTAQFVSTQTQYHTDPWTQQDQATRLSVAAIEAEQAGLSRTQIQEAERIWQFFAAGRRMPPSERLLLAFEAVWEIRQYEFARHLARYGWGEVSESSSSLDR